MRKLSLYKIIRLKDATVQHLNTGGLSTYIDVLLVQLLYL